MMMPVTSFEEKLREFCTERGDSTVQEAGEDGYGSGKVNTFKELLFARFTL